MGMLFSTTMLPYFNLLGGDFCFVGMRTEWTKMMKCYGFIFLMVIEQKKSHFLSWWLCMRHVCMVLVVFNECCRIMLLCFVNNVVNCGCSGGFSRIIERFCQNPWYCEKLWMKCGECYHNCSCDQTPETLMLRLQFGCG